jgi:negative regulator of sigma-B (phosphoserine phosphatase)
MQKDPGIQWSPIEWGVAARALPGQAVSGDIHLVKPFQDGVLVALIDGVGHGDEATAAARTAAATLADNPAESVIWLIKRCHESLAKTRGVVMTLAAFHAIEGTMTWLGVGNVEGLLLRADTNANPGSERVLLRGGLVGLNLPPLYASVIPVSRRDLLVFATDGIRGEFMETLVQNGDSPKQIADRIMARHFKGIDDALVLAVRYLGPRHE